MPPSSPPAKSMDGPSLGQVVDQKADEQESQAMAAGDKVALQKQDLAKDIQKSYKGYEDGVRKRLKLDADNRPKVGLWVCLSTFHTSKTLANSLHRVFSSQ